MVVFFFFFQFHSPRGHWRFQGGMGSGWGHRWGRFLVAGMQKRPYPGKYMSLVKSYLSLRHC